MLPNVQSMFLGKIALEDLAVVGLAEKYERSVALFEAVFGCKLPPINLRENVNPDRAGDFYAIDPVFRKTIDLYCAADVELYPRAVKRFDQLVARYGV